MKKFSEIYNKFLYRITDYSILGIPIEIREELLGNYLEEAIVRFSPYCKKDLFDINKDNMEFNVDLDSIEIYILVENMTISWIKRKRDTEEHTQNMLGEKDYSVFSPANLLSSINKVYESMNNELFSLMNEYSMQDFDPVDLMKVSYDE